MISPTCRVRKNARRLSEMVAAKCGMEPSMFDSTHLLFAHELRLHLEVLALQFKITPVEAQAYIDEDTLQRIADEVSAMIDADNP